MSASSPSIAADARALAEDLSRAMVEEARFSAERERVSSPDVREYAYASGYSDCTRELVLSMRHPWTGADADAETLVRMEIGSERERALTLRLKRAEEFSKSRFRLIGGQHRIVLKANDGSTLISGRCDALIEVGKETVAACEFKNWSPYLTDRIETFDDLLRVSRWTRKGAAQLSAYVWGAGVPLGLFFLARNGLPKILSTSYAETADLAEAFMRRAEEARLYVTDGAPDDLPDFPADLSVCHGCPYNGNRCHPPTVAAGGPVELDEERIGAVARYADIEEQKREANRLWDRIRQWYAARPGLVYVGDYVLEALQTKAKKRVADLSLASPQDRDEIRLLQARLEAALAPWTREEQIVRLELRRGPKAVVTESQP